MIWVLDRCGGLCWDLGYFVGPENPFLGLSGSGLQRVFTPQDCSPRGPTSTKDGAHPVRPLRHDLVFHHYMKGLYCKILASTLMKN